MISSPAKVLRWLWFNFVPGAISFCHRSIASFSPIRFDGWPSSLLLYSFVPSAIMRWWGDGGGGGGEAGAMCDICFMPFLLMSIFCVWVCVAQHARHIHKTGKCYDDMRTWHNTDNGLCDKCLLHNGIRAKKSNTNHLNFYCICIEQTIIYLRKK